LAWNNAQGNGGSTDGLISADGRFVAFNSRATNLSRHRDTNRVRDVFVRDRQRGTTVRVSVDSQERQANGGSFVNAISARGRFVLFTSKATNLVAADTNGAWDVFVRDLKRGVTRRVDISPQGRQLDGFGAFGEDISSNGRYVLIQAFPEGPAEQLLLRDRRLGVTRVVPHTFIVEADFIRARVSDGARFITYSVVDIGSGMGEAFRFNRETGKTSRLVGLPPHTQQWISDMTPDGRFLLVTSEHEVGGQGCRASDVWVRDMRKKRSIRVTGPTTGGCRDKNLGVSISSDGRLVTFTSELARIVAGDRNGVEDVFRRNILTGATIRISVAADGSQLALPSSGGSMSSGGRWAVFTTRSAVTPGDTNNRRDVYRRGPLP